MGKLLSDRQVAAYRRDGYVFPLPAMSAEAAAGYRGALEAYETDSGGPIAAAERIKTHLLFGWANRLVRHPAILDAVEDIVGPNILCWGTNFFNKPARDPGYVSYHQDANYWGLEPHDVITAWLALSDVPMASGPMGFVPGSHRGPSHAHTDTFHPDNLLSRGQEIAVDVDEATVVHATMRAGEFSLHHVGLIHGSQPNASNGRRVAFAIRYIPPHVRQIGVRASATLVRGRDDFGHFDLEPDPAADRDAAALAAHADAIARMSQNLMAGVPGDKSHYAPFDAAEG